MTCFCSKPSNVCLIPSKTPSPANEPSSSTTPLYLFCVFLRHAPTLHSLHWLLPQPRINNLPPVTHTSFSCHARLCSDVALSMSTFQTNIFRIATSLHPATVLLPSLLLSPLFSSFFPYCLTLHSRI